MRQAARTQVAAEPLDRIQIGGPHDANQGLFGDVASRTGRGFRGFPRPGRRGVGLCLCSIKEDERPQGIADPGVLSDVTAGPARDMTVLSSLTEMTSNRHVGVG